MATARQLETARSQRELARTKLETLQLTQTYRAIDDNHNRHKRATPSIEIKGEDDDLGKLGRLKAVAKARDTRRNYGGAKAAETQLALNVVGTGPKVIVHLDDEAKQEEWGGWFNGTFAKRCDGRGNLHLADQAKLVFTGVVREGDVLAYFDRTGVIPKAEGTLWYWEADQLPEIAQADWKNHKAEIAGRLGLPADSINQHHGLIVDEWGREAGYIVSRGTDTRGRATAKFDEVTILPADDCRLLFNPWRINQKRGISDTLENANILHDLERFTEALIQRSIVQSFLALQVKKRDGVIQGRDAVTSSENPDGVPAVTSDEVGEGARYKNFEKLSMNAIQYLEPDETVESLQLSGDLPDAQELISFMQRNAGWSQGLSAMYATGKADASYSASMAEANMSWAMFWWWQKWTERYYWDWVAEKAFGWAVETNRLTPAREYEWLDNYSWHGWPKKQAINPAAEASGIKTSLEIGAIDYSDIHGPGWKKKLGMLGTQIKYSRDAGLWVPLWAPKAGSTPA